MFDTPSSYILETTTTLNCFFIFTCFCVPCPCCKHSVNVHRFRMSQLCTGPHSITIVQAFPHLFTWNGVRECQL